MNIAKLTKDEKNKFLNEKFRKFRNTHNERKIKSIICKKYPELKPVDPKWFKLYPALAWIILISKDSLIDERMRIQESEMVLKLTNYLEV